MLECLFDEEEEGFSMSSYEPEPPDEATLWEEKITRAVDLGEAEFTWKYVPFLSMSGKRCIYRALKGRGAYIYTSIGSRAQ